jgi:hypothetical protein
VSDRLFRVYEPFECGRDGYPHVWKDATAITMPSGAVLHDNSDSAVGRGVKDIVREEAGHRCIRCGHPYKVGGSSTWSDTVDKDAARPSADPALFADLEPYLAKQAKRQTLWSPCDEQCNHDGPIRMRNRRGEWTTVPLNIDEGCEVQAAWRILTVHHLNGRKHDLRWWNLVSLCQRCHLYIQRKVLMERVYPWEHSDWFKPYAAGWYAYAYLGEDLSRSEVESRMDELLALERAA